MDDAADAVLACLAASGCASRTISTEAAQAIGHAITENAPADLIFDLEQLTRPATRRGGADGA